MRRFVDWQQRICSRFDRLLPAEYSVSGKRHFLQEIVTSHLPEHAVVYDIGGGKNPTIPTAEKAARHLHVVGLDADLTELAKAPDAAYDRTVVADITRFKGGADADLVICSTVFEHVRDTEAAISVIATILRPGGRLLIFVPSRNALFARLNLLLPEAVKRGIMFALFPQKRRLQGFPAYYNKCTPREMRALLARYGYEVEQLHTYYKSNYFSFLVPLYVLWRFYQLIQRPLRGEQAAETFTIVARKIQGPSWNLP
jgi:2-polyprenyl-6-hydroxyphenyl methylase/3-demethylubiquinone-9 3-methyltransferase